MLNEEQMRMVEDNHNLIYKFIHDNKLELNEWYGIIAESLMKAVKSYDSERGKLSTLFFSIAKRDYYRELRKPVDLVGIKDTIEIQNEPESIDLCLDSFLFEVNLDDIQKEIVRYLYEGYTHKEIGEMIGLARSTVSDRVAIIKREVKSSL